MTVQASKTNCIHDKRVEIVSGTVYQKWPQHLAGSPFPSITESGRVVEYSCKVVGDTLYIMTPIHLLLLALNPLSYHTALHSHTPFVPWPLNIFYYVKIRGSCRTLMDLNSLQSMPLAGAYGPVNCSTMLLERPRWLISKRFRSQGYQSLFQNVTVSRPVHNVEHFDERRKPIEGHGTPEHD